MSVSPVREIAGTSPSGKRRFQLSLWVLMALVAVVAIGLVGWQSWQDYQLVKPWIAVLKSGPAFRKSQAAEQLGTFGPHARLAVPALIEATRDREVWVRSEAYHALARIEPHSRRVHEVLIEGFGDTDPNTRNRAVWGLCGTGPASRRTIEKLGECLESDRPSIRQGAWVALQQVGTADNGAVPHLLRVLRGEVEIAPTWEGEQTRFQTTYAIAGMKPEPAVVFPVVQELFQAHDIEGQAVATRLLMDLALREGAEEVPGLTDAVLATLNSRDPILREMITSAALVHLEPEARKEAVARLVEQLRDPDPARVEQTARLLAHLDPENRAAVPVLAEQLESNDPQRRVLALAVMVTLGHSAAGVGPALGRSMLEPEAFEPIEPTVVIPPILRETTGGNGTSPIEGSVPGRPTWADLVARALKRMAGWGTPETVEVLAGTLERDPDALPRLFAARGLAKLGPPTRNVPPALRAAATGDPDPDVRAAAAEAIESMTTQGTPP